MKFLLSIAFFSILSTSSAQLTSKNVSSDFTFVVDGERKKLSDFRGQVVYVSFWASWCKPCINNFRTYKNLRNQLSEMGVMLLNVNIDKEEADFKNALEKLEIKGVTGYAGNDPVLMEEYQLYSIPSYEIIQKDGYFYYLSDAPDRNIIEEFKGLVSK